MWYVNMETTGHIFKIIYLHNINTWFKRMILQTKVKLSTFYRTIFLLKKKEIRPVMTAFLTPLPLVPHICISESGQHRFRWWLVTYLAPSHYLNQCWVIANWTLRNKLQWNFDQNTKLFIHKNAFENIVCNKEAILLRGSWVNPFLLTSTENL